MLKTVKIENFRGFKSFELQQLGRVNLLVGMNNSGKTSILEAIQLLCSRNNLETLAEAMTNRGEYFWSDDGRGSRELDIRHLFYGHQIQLGSKFSISGMNDNSQQEVVASIAVRRNSSRQTDERSPNQISLFSLFDEGVDEFKGLSFIVQWTHGQDTEIVPLSLSPDTSLSINSARSSFRRNTDMGFTKTQFVTSSSLTIQKMIELFNQVVLTPEEALVQEALQTIEPKIERIASISPQRFKSTLDSRGGFVVRLSDSTQRVPIGSMGDGIWRILGLALSCVCARDGFLFVDEIDTGFHFTAMSDMWKLIWKTATRLNVQVFATTHNSDCWTSLANLAAQEEKTDDGMTIQRIERDKETSVVFTEPEIVIAAERGIEVR